MDFESQLPQGEPHQATVNLIQCAYPLGIPEPHYMTLLSILAENMSIRVLAGVIAHVRNGHYIIYMGDVMTAMSYKPNESLYLLVKSKLDECGYDKWLKEGF